MWSFSIVLWEMVTHEIPFADLSPMQIGIQVAHENLVNQKPTFSFYKLLLARANSKRHNSKHGGSDQDLHER